jgi:chromosome segregation ATPase|tara:strand:+ start:316 stop:684 length:369 start_codon:yes stop_codon:yes gene_type:complete
LKKIFDNIQAIFIVILAAALILSFIFRPSKPIETYENEINSLKQQNQQLLLSNDSINLINTKLQKEINVILIAIDSTKVVLKEKENKIKELEKKRNEVPTIINNMHSDDVTNSFSDYLKRRN